jgi:hypothetical protein
MSGSILAPKRLLVEPDRTLGEAVEIVGTARRKRFETLDEIGEASHEAVDHWNTYHHPYVWKKRLQEPFPMVGQFRCLSPTQLFGEKTL